MKKFDLNIEKVLEHWTIPHALREIIANALDESYLTNTEEPRIFKDVDNHWHIKDFGRGLKYEHLTQNENDEKTNNPDKVIGKFGVGLKDALATFDRRNIGILIQSKYSDITIDKLTKGDFDDVITLHAIVKEPSHPGMIGTEFIFTGLKDEDIEQAKDFFLLYSGERKIEKTKYGQLIENKKNRSRIYVNGICVAEEENLLFSYNITSTTKKLRQSLNRERSNVGRSAYTDRVKSILLDCKGAEFAEKLVNDLQKIQAGNSHDELDWIDVQVHACKILSSQEKVMFLTANSLMDGGKYLSYAKDEGIRIITVPDSLAFKLGKSTDLNGNQFRNLESYAIEWNEQFEFDIIKVHQLTNKEREVFNHRDIILSWFPKKGKVVKDILISTTMRPDSLIGSDALGIWESSTRQIIIKRSQLKSLQSFAGTLVHELVHAHTGTDDNTIEFEIELTEMLGKLSALILETPRAEKSKSRFRRLFDF
ncbi:D-tyrosyl-tRNA deacylase [Bacillus sp. FJAT-27916]|uniref:D-tyrosyl-tRNA deacylase n=1 Tax=Bacillus sp. FJAT-27916 TaxID=1679169 RepID=UPI0006709B8F|nr:D-tyrosyl-tRNA deacylase [Bacillus sp. FJAT-27916]KMY43391.1 D-tyrosyl-tRNA deacylase [Bacillus sp. FJAT-27916]